MSVLIRNGTLAQLSPPLLLEADILIDGDTISAIMDGIDQAGHDVFEANGRLIMPGNVCAHTHIYSALARGMPAPPRTPHNFREILELIWWRLDRALDEPSLRASAEIAAIDALRSGTTTLIDHHASPHCIEGSLSMLAEPLSATGVRGILCYEVTDRNGRDGRDAGVCENARFAREVAGHWPSIRAMVGGHASFTLDDEALDAIVGTARDLDIGIHIHVAEDAWDEEDSMRRAGVRVAHRLDRHGILNDQSLLAHCVHLDSSETELIGQRTSWIAHNCRSNLNNSVGRAPIRTFPAGRVALGTDGIDQDMFSESRAAFFRLREETLEATANQVTNWLTTGGNLAAQSFGRPLGRLLEGHLADLVVYDYRPPTPLTAGNLPWHWMFAFTNSPVTDVMVNGRWVLRDGSVEGVDEAAVRAHAREEAVRLWRRMEELPT